MLPIVSSFQSRLNQIIPIVAGVDFSLQIAPCTSHGMTVSQGNTTWIPALHFLLHSKLDLQGSCLFSTSHLKKQRCCNVQTVRPIFMPRIPSSKGAVDPSWPQTAFLSPVLRVRGLGHSCLCP